MELNCKFEYQNWSFEKQRPVYKRNYVCDVTIAEIDKPGIILGAFNGTHQAGKSHEDVDILVFTGARMKHFPRGIHKIFPHLRVLQVLSCGLTTINRIDLSGLEFLERLDFEGNELESLPSDLLVGMPRLRCISFFGNQIKFMSSDILKPVVDKGLSYVNFQNNKSISALYHTTNPESVASIDELMKFIDEKCTKPMPETPDHNDLSTRTRESLTTAVSHLWESKNFTDFTVITGSKIFRVHKFVLATHSSKFAEMLTNQEVNEITIEDLDEVVVEAFLHYFYTGVISSNADFIKLFKLSSTLDAADLTSYCEDMILSILQESNAFDIFNLGHAYDNKAFKVHSFEKIRSMFPDIKMPDSLVEKPDKLKKLFEMRQLLNSIKEDFEDIGRSEVK